MFQIPDFPFYPVTATEARRIVNLNDQESLQTLRLVVSALLRVPKQATALAASRPGRAPRLPRVLLDDDDPGATFGRALGVQVSGGPRAGARRTGRDDAPS